MRRVALLGCGGFIGSHLLAALLRRGDFEVVGWDSDAHRLAPLRHHPRCDFIEGDLYRDPELVARLAACEVVISLAAICWPSRYAGDGIAVIESNFLQPARLFEALTRRGAWLLHFSTSEVYGKTLASQLGPEAETRLDLNLLREDESPLLLGPVHSARWSYACAKQLLERWIYAQHRERGLRFTVVRPFNFIGPHMDFLPGFEAGEGVPRVLACFLSALLKGEPFPLVDGGLSRRTFLHIDDAVDAVLRMLDRPEAAQNQIFNLGHPGNEVAIRELAGLMRAAFAEATGRPEYRTHPEITVAARDFYGEGYDDSDRRLPDIRKARTLLGWEPRMSLPEALRRIAVDAVARHARHALLSTGA